MRKLKSLADIPVIDFRNVTNDTFDSVAKYVQLDCPNIFIDGYNVYVCWPTEKDGLSFQCINIFGTCGMDDGSGDPENTNLLWNANGKLQFNDAFDVVDGATRLANFN